MLHSAITFQVSAVPPRAAAARSADGSGLKRPAPPEPFRTTKPAHAAASLYLILSVILNIKDDFFFFGERQLYLEILIAFYFRDNAY